MSDVCVICKSNTSPKSKSKGRKKKSKVPDPDKPADIGWIECDSCSRWFHSDCVRISEALMKRASDFLFYCEECSIRGCFLPKEVAGASSKNSLETDRLDRLVEELTTQLIALKTEIEDAKRKNKKQLDQLQSRISDAGRLDDRCVAHSDLINNIGKKLEAIETGAKLANTCSQSVNSFRIAINKVPHREGENVRFIVASILNLLGIQSEMSKVVNCFRLQVRASKWSDRSISPTIVAVFSSRESRDNVIRCYFQKHKSAKLCNLQNGPPLDYRFTLNEVLAPNAFRIRNYALRLKHQKLVKSVFVRHDKVSVLLPGGTQYVPIVDTDQLRKLTERTSCDEESSVFFDAASASFSTTSSC